jgi:hypothetical protein
MTKIIHIDKKLFLIFWVMVRFLLETVGTDIVYLRILSLCKAKL